MRRVLVAFASREGQTEHIAHHVARKLEDKGFGVRLIDLLENASEAGADDCEAAILATSIHQGAYDPHMANFVMRHGPSLREGLSVFLSVSLAAASDEPAERASIDEIARKFVADNGWTPDAIWHVAGALHDRRMTFLEREVLHAIIDSKGVERHPSGDTEFTDWAALDQQIADFAKVVPEPILRDDDQD